MSPIIKELPFTHNDADYIIQVISAEDQVSVQLLSASDHEPCGFERIIRLPNRCYMDALLKLETVRKLLEEARNDIIDDRWKHDVAALNGSVVAERLSYSCELVRDSYAFDHVETFDRPITQASYEEHLESVDYHGYPRQGYGVGIRQGDVERKVWIYRASRSCD